MQLGIHSGKWFLGPGKAGNWEYCITFWPIFKDITHKIRLPWFRVHIVILNDPGRLISVHIMHSGLAAGWSGAITFYELIILDPTDPVYNPIWRQGCYVIPFISRLGVIRSLYD